jgi:hypothetical protein
MRVTQTTQPQPAANVGRQKGQFAMPIAPNLRSRLEKLESVLAPAARVFIFTGVPRADSHI